MENQKEQIIATGTIFGVAIGAIIGLFFNNLVLGAAFGSGIGVIAASIFNHYKYS